MEHRTIDEVGRAARIVPVGMPKMSRRERLERWATLLMQHPQRPLKPFIRIEFMSEVERARLHGEDTPLAIAYRDPGLRKEGLAGDTLGDALAVLDMSG